MTGLGEGVAFFSRRLSHPLHAARNGRRNHGGVPKQDGGLTIKKAIAKKARIAPKTTGKKNIAAKKSKGGKENDASLLGKLGSLFKRRSKGADDLDAAPGNNDPVDVFVEVMHGATAKTSPGSKHDKVPNFDNLDDRSDLEDGWESEFEDGPDGESASVGHGGAGDKYSDVDWDGDSDDAAAGRKKSWLQSLSGIFSRKRGSKDGAGKAGKKGKGAAKDKTPASEAEEEPDEELDLDLDTDLDDDWDEASAQNRKNKAGGKGKGKQKRGPRKKGGGNGLKVLLLLVILGAGAYYVHTEQLVDLGFIIDPIRETGSMLVDLLMSILPI